MSDPAHPHPAHIPAETPANTPASPAATTYSETRWYVRCEACGDLRQSVIVSGYPTAEEADAAAERHALRHAENPHCICATTCTDLSEDHDCRDGDCGHRHCRHHAMCCECGCMSRTLPDLDGN